MAEQTKLFCSYIDDYGNVQGPFEVEKIVKWHSGKHFQDHHVLRFTDNVRRNVTYETTIGELKEKCAGKIPTTVEMLNEAGIRVKEETKLAQLIALGAFENTVEGIVSKSMIKKESSKENEAIEKRRSEEQRERRQRSRFSYRPFYDGSKHKDDDWLHSEIAVEFAGLLKKKYDHMRSNERNRLHLRCRIMWKLPIKCKACHCPLVAASNFLSHVLSEGHIRKRMNSRGVTFSFSNDYLELKQLFSRYTRSPSRSPSSERSCPPEVLDVNNSDTHS